MRACVQPWEPALLAWQSGKQWSCVLLGCPPASADAAVAAEGADEPHRHTHQLAASVACMPRSLLIFRSGSSSFEAWQRLSAASAHPRAALAGPPCSSSCPVCLLARRDEAYTSCLHGILEAAAETIDCSVVNADAAGLQIGQQLPRGGERISLTIRRVLRQYNIGIRL